MKSRYTSIEVAYQRLGIFLFKGQYLSKPKKSRDRTQIYMVAWTLTKTLPKVILSLNTQRQSNYILTTALTAKVNRNSNHGISFCRFMLN